MDIRKLLSEAQQGGFFSYVAGVASYMKERYDVGGAKITVVKRDMPLKSGLASSAAICVLVARAFNRLYHLDLRIEDEMDAAFIGEQRTHSHCGRMDQSCAYGTGPILMTFDGNKTDIRRLNVGATFHWVIANLMASKDTVTILADLNKSYPFADSVSAQRVQRALGVENQRIVSEAVRYIEEGDPEQLGKLMTEAQCIFDEMVMPSCPELKAPVLHSVLNDKHIKKWIYGAKGVGSQGDGTVQFLTKGENESNKLREYLWNEKGMLSYPHTIIPRQNVKKAVIPLAGAGTRLFPATKAMKKSLMPFVDSDGLLKPLLLILLDRVIAAGINEVALVIGPNDKDDVERLFAPFAPDNLDSLSPAQRLMEKRIAEIRTHISFIVQEECKGFGHAVWLSRSFAESEPVLLLLGDFAFQSFTDKSCCKQIMDAYAKCGKALIGISEISLCQVIHYGVVHGVWNNDDNSFMTVDQMIEKPDIFYADKHLRVKDKEGKEKIYATFGQYIITSEVYDALDTEIRSGIPADGKEFDLTNALRTVSEKDGLVAFLPTGKAFDIGRPDAYREAMISFGKPASSEIENYSKE